MDTFKSELIELVKFGLMRVQRLEEDRATDQAINIVQGLFTRIENAEHVAQQERSWSSTQQDKLEKVRAVVTKHFYTMERQGRGSTHEWIKLEDILTGRDQTP